MVFQDESFVERIIKLKTQKQAVMLAHNYQLGQIQDVADFLGDSLELAKRSKGLGCKMIIFCGVRFMAETAKILSPEKKVVLPVEDAGCPLADTITVEDLQRLKATYPDAKVVSYVNSSAEIKAESDVCCTSANASTVVENIDVPQIIFVPDANLGRWVQKNNPSKKLIIWPGSCYVHQQFTLEDLQNARKSFPEAEILVHPECRPEVQDNADFVVSTSGMLKRAKSSQVKTLIIATEEGLIYRLKKENPKKEFYSLGNSRICLNMKKTTLAEVLAALEDEKPEVSLKDDVIKKARKALEEMVKFI
ncbi:MAG: quinolinate synthase NadA [Candidatus Omnitrophica bacterium]|nr:quinolinate synthase NadA [Candidatus Omnitrophota bacterium]